MSAMRRALVPLLLLAACGGSTPSAVRSAASGDVAELLRLHEVVMEAHRRSDAELLVGDSPDDFVLVNRGEVKVRSRAERLPGTRAYLGSTTYRRYADLRPPLVKVSRDGTLGWVIVQVEAEGTAREGDKSEPVAFVAAWVELYEKRDGRWVSVGNVSNFRP